MADAKASLKINVDRIIAIGIDAPLGFDYGTDRRIDEAIRHRLKSSGSSSSSTPIAQNSLRGACLAQGLLIGHLAIESGIDLISESFPRAVSALYPTLQASCMNCSNRTVGCHECDATLSAASGWAMRSNFVGESIRGWENWHALQSSALRPDWFVIPDHEYWLPA